MGKIGIAVAPAYAARLLDDLQAAGVEAAAIVAEADTAASRAVVLA